MRVCTYKISQFEFSTSDSIVERSGTPDRSFGCFRMMSGQQCSDYE